jgi:hypothetical protein
MKKYIVDIDGTICTWEKDGRYENASPYKDRILKINQLFDDGNEVHYWTARGRNSGRDLTELTTKQLHDWGCKYTTLKCDKPAYDLWIDDKCIHERDYFGVSFEW